MTLTRQRLIDKYLQYKREHDRAPNMYSTPNVYELAGYYLQYSAPMHIAEAEAGGTDPFKIGPFWSHVRAIILTVLKQEGGA